MQASATTINTSITACLHVDNMGARSMIVPSTALELRWESSTELQGHDVYGQHEVST